MRKLGEDTSGLIRDYIEMAARVGRDKRELLKKWNYSQQSVCLLNKYQTASHNEKKPIYPFLCIRGYIGV